MVREKLLAIKKREEMKDLIVNKLKKKHSTREDSDKDDCSSEKSAMINKEVNRLLDNTNIPVTGNTWNLSYCADRDDVRGESQ